MQEFENYVKSNYIIPGAAACAIKYTFTTRETIDKPSKIPVIIYTIVMKMTWFDKYGQQLQMDISFGFGDDSLSTVFNICVKRVMLFNCEHADEVLIMYSNIM